MGILEIFDVCPGDICSVSWRYLNGVLEVFDWCLGDILWVVLETFDGCPADI